MPIVSVLERLCKENGTTITALERKCGFSLGSIRKWDAHAPTIPKLEAVAKELGTTVSYIIGEKNPASANGDGISEHDVRLLEWFHSLPEEKRRAILEIAGGPKE